MVKIGWWKCCVLMLIWPWSPGTGQTIVCGVILCHSLKLRIRRWLLIRCIDLGRHVAKVMTRVLAGRLSWFSEKHNLPEYQAEFSPGRGCADQILCDIMRSLGIWTIRAFLDISMAYDILWRKCG